MTSRNHALNEFIKREEARVTTNNNNIIAGVTCKCMYVYMFRNIYRTISKHGWNVTWERREFIFSKRTTITDEDLISVLRKGKERM